MNFISHHAKDAKKINNFTHVYTNTMTKFKMDNLYIVKNHKKDNFRKLKMHEIFLLLYDK